MSRSLHRLPALLAAAGLTFVACAAPFQLNPAPTLPSSIPEPPSVPQARAVYDDPMVLARSVVVRRPPLRSGTVFVRVTGVEGDLPGRFVETLLARGVTRSVPLTGRDDVDVQTTRSSEVTLRGPLARLPMLRALQSGDVLLDIEVYDDTSVELGSTARYELPEAGMAQFRREFEEFRAAMAAADRALSPASEYRRLADATIEDAGRNGILGTPEAQATVANYRQWAASHDRIQAAIQRLRTTEDPDAYARAVLARTPARQRARAAHLRITAYDVRGAEIFGTIDVLARGDTRDAALMEGFKRALSELGTPEVRTP